MDNYEINPRTAGWELLNREYGDRALISDPCLVIYRLIKSLFEK